MVSVYHLGLSNLNLLNKAKVINICSIIDVNGIN